MFMLMLFFTLLVFSNIDILLSHNIGPFYREFNPILVLFDITLSDFIVIASYFGNFVFFSLFVDIFYFIKIIYIIKGFMDGYWLLILQRRVLITKIVIIKVKKG